MSTATPRPKNGLLVSVPQTQAENSHPLQWAMRPTQGDSSSKLCTVKVLLGQTNQSEARPTSSPARVPVEASVRKGACWGLEEEQKAITTG